MGGFCHIWWALSRFGLVSDGFSPASGAIRLSGVGLGFPSMTDQTQQVDAELAPEVPASPPRTYLVWSALAAALLFLPIGLVALFFSIRTEVLLRRGETDRARRTSRAALALIIVTVVAGVLAYVVVIGGLLALGAFSGG